MKHSSLATHYRPQTFAQVTGQDLITTVLSRAAAQEQLAAAYLLSGTRGVGKTTIARILAKALNCNEAPTAEPCNVCNQCRMITQGSHVDVIEIDGASNNGVDDARALRENIGYAPMEGRYKVFIIDEAHMLTRSAFNALLKTLEEPPPRVVFIFATTEVHKFPITIVSRCQHFVFKQVPEDILIAHLSRILNEENATFDIQAVRIIAKRAAGSVRDGMSLLGQTLALGGDNLSVENTRNVLGLAGQELFITLFNAISGQNCPKIIEIMQNLSAQGIDIVFFLRELTHLWRTLFLLSEVGQSIASSLELNQDEYLLWSELAKQFSTAHLHSAWHMSLDAQHKIIHSPEPASALELLLLNLTLLPRLLPLNVVQNSTPKDTPPLASPNNAEQQGRQDNQVITQSFAEQTLQEQKKNDLNQNVVIQSQNFNEVGATSQNIEDVDITLNDHVQVNEKKNILTQDTAITNSKPSTLPSWESVQNSFKGTIGEHILRQSKGEFLGNVLRIQTKAKIVFDTFLRKKEILAKIVSDFCQVPIEIDLVEPNINYKPENILIEEFSTRAELQEILNIFNASICKVRPIN